MHTYPMQNRPDAAGKARFDPLCISAVKGWTSDQNADTGRCLGRKNGLWDSRTGSLYRLHRQLQNLPGVLQEQQGREELT